MILVANEKPNELWADLICQDKVVAHPENLIWVFRRSHVLNNSVAAIDPLGLAYFAERTILGSGTENFDNLPLYHEQLFFEDGYYPENWGYLGYQGMGPDYSHGNEYTREDGPYK
jgi:hypothetical protein